MTSRRLLGVGAGALVVAVASGAGGPIGGSLDAFMKPPGEVPVPDVVLPDVDERSDLPGVTRRPLQTQSSDGLAADAIGPFEIPAPALRAYRTAEAIMRSSSPSCGLTWEVLAGIGRVESDHGRFGGAVVGEDGVSTPQIYGVPLNGVGDVAAIADTEGGAMDGDSQWDRAVGPMQFLPTTWDVVGVDADKDGVANPHDLDDAALAAAVYLCAGDVDLRDREQLREALWRYNPSEEYVALVLSYIDAYRRGETTPISVSQVDDTSAPSGQPVQGPGTQPGNQPGNSPPTNGTGDTNGTGGTNGPGDTDGTGGTVGPGWTGDTDGNGPGGQSPPTQSPPTQEPPTQEPPTQEPPDEDPPTQPPDDNEPQPDTMTGVLVYDNDTAKWSIRETFLYFGTDEELARASATDYDRGQESSETLKQELLGLVASEREITVGLDWTADGVAVVTSIDGSAYPSYDSSGDQTGTGDGSGSDDGSGTTEPTPTPPEPTPTEGSGTG